MESIGMTVLGNATAPVRRAQPEKAFSPTVLSWEPDPNVMPVTVDSRKALEPIVMTVPGRPVSGGGEVHLARGAYLHLRTYNCNAFVDVDPRTALLDPRIPSFCVCFFWCCCRGLSAARACWAPIRPLIPIPPLPCAPTSACTTHTCILSVHRSKPTGDFSLDGLTNDRVDLIARCITATFHISFGT